MAVIITVISPAVGTPISKHTPLVVEVTSSTTLQRVFLSVSMGGVLPEEVVHRGGTTFAPTYQNSTNARASIAGGYRFTVLRDGGWPGLPSLHVEAVDLP